MSHICCTVPVVLAHGSTRRTCPGSLSLARSLVSPFHIPANLRVTCGLTLRCPARGLTRFLSPIQARSGLEQRQWSIFSHRSCEGTTDIRDICDTAACDPIEAPCRSILDPNLVHPAKQPGEDQYITSDSQHDHQPFCRLLHVTRSDINSSSHPCPCPCPCPCPANSQLLRYVISISSISSFSWAGQTGSFGSADSPSFTTSAWGSCSSPAWKSGSPPGEKAVMGRIRTSPIRRG
jgi:hypothetical protein